MRNLILALTFLLFACSTTEKKSNQLSALKISDNHRYFAQENGEPFFWLGDTGWLLFSKLDRNEAEHYLNDRKAKGFNVLQVMLLHELGVANVYGDSALVAKNVAQPKITEGNDFDDTEAYDYWDHVDFITDLAAERGIYLALVPVWGSNVRGGKVSANQAEVYAKWLAERFAGRQNIIWLNGGDTKGSKNTEVWQAIGRQLDKHAKGQLITFHPFGRCQSAMWFHDEEWLDFNMFQSGHRRYDQDDTELAYGQDNYKYVRDDYARSPIKPTLDGEPSYEGIPQGLHDTTQPYWNANDLRRYAYWSVFAGAAGFTYGHSAIMQMHKPDNQHPAYGVREFWTEALNAEGAQQMIHLKQLMLSKAYFDHVPDQSLIATEQGERYNYQAATRGNDYAFIYTYNGREIDVKMGKIKGEKLHASWFNPRNGKRSSIGTVVNQGTKQFDPPGNQQDGNDWVLVLEADK